MKIYIDEEGKKDDVVHYYLSKKGHLPSLEFIGELKEKLKQHFNNDLQPYSSEAKTKSDLEFPYEVFTDARNRIINIQKAKITKIRKFLVR